MAAITVTNIGTGQNKTGAQISITTPTVTTGTIILVAVCDSGTSNTNLPSDTQGNTYATVQSVFNNSTGTADGFTALYYAIVTTALTGSDSIRYTPTNAAGGAVTAFYLTNVNLSIPWQVASLNTGRGSSTAPQATTSVAQVDPGTCVIGVVGTHGPQGDTFTQDSTHATFVTPPTRVGSTGGNANTNYTIGGGSVVRTGTTETALIYGPTITSRPWGVIIAAFQPNLVSGVSGTSGVGTLTPQYSYSQALTGVQASGFPNLPAIDYNFVTSQSIPSGLTFTRASNGYYFDSTGTLQSASNNVARFEYDPTSIVTNYIVNSQTIGGTGWTQSLVSVTPNAATAPDGSSTASLITDNTTNGQHLAYATPACSPTLIGQPYTGSVYAKAGSSTSVQITLWGESASPSFNLVAGTASAGGVITSVGNGWYRCSYTWTRTTNSFDYFYVAPVNTGTYTGTGVGAYFWGAQFEIGSTLHSYVATSGSTASSSPTFSGLLIEPGSTNYIRNPRGEGGTAGNVSGGALNGTMPTNWTVDGNGGGLTEYLGTGTVNGIPTTKWRIHGTLTDTNPFGINPERGSAFITGLAVNTNLAPSFWCRITAGSTSGISSFNFWGDARDNANAGVVGIYQTAFTPTGTWTRFSLNSGSAWIVNGGAGAPYSVVGMGMVIYTNGIGAVVDCTLEIGGFQLEVGDMTTSLMLPAVSSPAASSRSADQLSNTSIGSWYKSGQGSVYSENMVGYSQTTQLGFPALWQFDDGTNNNRWEGYLGSNTADDVRFEVDYTSNIGDFQLTTGSASANTTFRTAVSINANRAAYTRDGASVVTGTPTHWPLSGINELWLGALAGGNILLGYIRRFRYWPTTLPDGYLQWLSAGNTDVTAVPQVGGKVTGVSGTGAAATLSGGTFSRAGSATYIDASGTMQLASSNVLRTDYSSCSSLGVTSIGSNTGKSVSSVVITLPSAVPAGCTIFVAIATAGSSILANITDSVGQSNWISGNGAATANGTVILDWAWNATAMPASSTITITRSGGGTFTCSAYAWYVSGLVYSASPFDVAQTGSGTATTSVSLTTGTLNQIAEYVVGAIAVDGAGTETFTNDTNFSQLPSYRTGTTGGSDITIDVGMRTVTNLSAVTYAPTLGTTRDYAAYLATFKQTGFGQVLIETASTNTIPNANTGNPGFTATSSTDIPPLYSAATVWKCTSTGGSAYSFNNAAFVLVPITTNAIWTCSAWIYLPAGYNDAIIEIDFDIGVGTNSFTISGNYWANNSITGQWQRIWRTIWTGTNTTMNIVLRPSSTSTAGAIFYTSCWQVEANPSSNGYPSSYIPTSGSSASRALDTVSSTGLEIIGKNIVGVSGTSALGTVRRQAIPNGVSGYGVAQIQYEQWIRNQTASGASAPSTPPTNWWLSTPFNNVSATVIGSGTENGIPYVDYQWSGTSNNIYIAFSPEQPGYVTSGNETTWTFSAYLKLAGGSFTNVTNFQLDVQQFDSSVTFIQNDAQTFSLPTTAALNTQLFTTTQTTTSSNCVSVWPVLTFLFNSSSAAVNFTIRIGQPSLLPSGGYIPSDSRSISGVSGTSAVGTVSPQIQSDGSASISGVQRTSGVGSLIPSVGAVTSGITGTAGSGSAGSFVAGKPSGAVGTSGVGTLVAALQVSITGTSATGGVGFQSYNRIRNTTMSGAVVGTIGSGGSLPTHWSQAVANTMTLAVTGIGTISNMPYIDISVNGTVTDPGLVLALNLTEDVGWFDSPSAPIAAVAGQSWTATAYLALTSGSFPDRVSIGFNLLDASGVNTGFLLGDITPTGTLTQYTYTVALTGSTTTNVIPQLWFYANNGQSVSFTVRVSNPTIAPTSGYIPDVVATPAGVSGTGQAGVATAQDAKAITGVAGTGAAGTVTPRVSAIATGATASGSAGTATTQITLPNNVTGAAGTGAAGTATAQVAAIITGNAATGSAGVVATEAGTPNVSVPIIGVSANTGPYIPHAVRFDGSETLQTNSLTASDSPIGFASMWMYAESDAFNNDVAGFIGVGPGAYGAGDLGGDFQFLTITGSPFQWQFNSFNGVNGDIQFTWNSLFSTGSWQHVLLAWDVQNQKIALYLNDTLITPSASSISGTPPSTVLLSGQPFSVIASIIGTGSNHFPNNTVGRFADYQIYTGQSILQSDSTITVADRRNFIDGAKDPVNPTVATAAYGQPMCLFSGNAANFATNQGSGGAFTLTGSLTDIAGPVATATTQVTLTVSSATASGSVGSVVPSDRISISGVAGTGSAGSETAAVSAHATGVAASGQSGTASDQVAISILGAAAQGQAGVPTAQLSITSVGVAGTGQSGSVTDQLSDTISGVAGTSQSGTETARISITPTGVTATGQAGSVTDQPSVGIAGGTGNGQSGTLSAQDSVAITGLVGTSQIAAPSTQITLTLSGVSGAAIAGPLKASITITLSGVAASGASGSVTTSVFATVAGTAASGSAGTLSIEVAKTLAGVVASGQIGSTVASIATTLTGNSSNGSAGSLTVSELVFCTGVSATGFSGTTRVSTTPSVTGVLASGSSGTPTTSIAVTETNASASGAAGSFTVSEFGSFIGVTGNGSAGTTTPLLIVVTSGVAASGTVGTIGVDPSARTTGIVGSGLAGTTLTTDTITLSDVSATAQASDVTASLSNFISGASAAASIGTFLKTVSAIAAGLSAIGSAGTLSDQLLVQIAGTLASSAVGTPIADVVATPLGGFGTGEVGFPARLLAFGVEGATQVGDATAEIDVLITGGSGTGEAGDVTAQAVNVSQPAVYNNIDNTDFLRADPLANAILAASFSTTQPLTVRTVKLRLKKEPA